jgi:hypothetical protein
MAQGLILEWSEVDQGRYEAVNKELGIDAKTGKGDWPKGMIAHAGGSTEDGGFRVIELWESQADQAAFMDSRLMAALQAAGQPPPEKVTWVDLFAHHIA